MLLTIAGRAQAHDFGRGVSEQLDEFSTLVRDQAVWSRIIQAHMG